MQKQVKEYGEEESKRFKEKYAKLRLISTALRFCLITLMVLIFANTNEISKLIALTLPPALVIEIIHWKFIRCPACNKPLREANLLVRKEVCPSCGVELV